MPPDGRLVMILFDRTIDPTRNTAARKIARAAVDALGPGDVAAILHTQLGMPQGFTADRALLEAAIDRPFMGLSAGDEGNQGQCRCGVCALDAMTLLADAIRDVPRRRKTLLFVGTSLPVESGGTCDTTIRTSREALVRAAQAANMTIDALDPSGLNTLAPMADVSGAPTVERTPTSGPTAVMAEMQRQGTLGTYADYTGGRFVVNTNAPEDAVRPILRESSSYYELGFPPASTKADGRHHDIEVKVNRPGVTLQARKGYYAPGGKAAAMMKVPPGVEPALASAMASAWPKTDLPLDLDVAPFATANRKQAVVAVVVHASPNSAAGQARADHHVAVLSGAFDRFGKSLDYERATLIVPAGAAEYEVLTRLTLKPGRYEIRTSLDDGPGGTGSVYAYIDVPNFAAGGLALSGLAVGRTPPLVSGPRTAFNDVLPFVPTAERTFARTERATAFVRLYAGGKSAIVPVRVNALVTDDEGRSVFDQDSVVPAGRFDAGRSADFQIDLPLASLTAGPYLLALDFRQGNTVATRDVRFTVR